LTKCAQLKDVFSSFDNTADELCYSDLIIGDMYNADNTTDELCYNDLIIGDMCNA